MVNHHINVKHKTVAEVLSPSAHLRTAGRLRRRHYRSAGPCQTWHVDGYDKLKPYGFAISGCIDGFSRKLIWLECGPTNNDPNVIASYYINAVEREHGTPSHIRTDKGTENGILAAIQSTFSGHERAHSYGTSQSNQRIEQFWSYFRSMFSEHYMTLLKDFIEYGSFTVGNRQDTNVLRFVFMDLLRAKIQELVRNWNTHRMRKNTSINFPGGRPEVMHDTNPSLKNDVEEAQLQQFKVQYPLSSARCDDHDFEQYLQYICEHHNIHTAVRTSNEAFILYETLQHKLSCAANL